MGYVKASSGSAIAPETIAAFATLLGLAMPSDEVPVLSASVRDQFDSIAALEELDLLEVMPAVEFDPRWRGEDERTR